MIGYSTFTPIRYNELFGRMEDATPQKPISMVVSTDERFAYMCGTDAECRAYMVWKPIPASGWKVIKG